MNTPHRKTFSDRYALLHEQQVLDYLNQRHAPVPQVILSHLEQSYLEMSDGGVDLQVWIRDSGATSAQVAKALALAVRAAMRVAELGVWHVDIALRNFVVRSMARGGPPTVWLIDFANAISDQFPLQKPLWMLPAPHQHPLLQRSLTLDWQAFYLRHALPPPDDWQEAFDVPLGLYREDWTSGLQVERITQRWCILAHGLGHMGLQMQDEMHQAFALPESDWRGFMHLDDDALARQRLEEGLRQLEAVRSADLSGMSTPRPRARAEKPTLSSAARTPAQALETTESAPPAAPAPVHAPVPAAPTPRAKPLKTQASALVRPPAAQPRSRPAWRWAAQLLNLGLIALGWLIVDVVYTRQGIVLSWLSWLAVLEAVLGAALGGLVALASRQRRAGWTLALLSQLVGQALMLLELWALRVPIFTLGVVGSCLALSASLTLTLAIRPSTEGDLTAR